MQTIKGRITDFLPKQEGDSSRGHWVKGGFAIEYGDTFQRKAAFTLFGEERMQQCAGMKVGDEVVVDYAPESREYNGRWYTDLSCIRVLPAAQQPSVPQQPQWAQPQYAQPQQTAQPQYAQPPAAAPQPTQRPAAQQSMPQDQDLPF